MFISENHQDFLIVLGRFQHAINPNCYLQALFDLVGLHKSSHSPLKPELGGEPSLEALLVHLVIHGPQP